MIPAFRTAIWSLGSGCILLAAAAFSADALRQRPTVAEIDVAATDAELGTPAEIAGDHFAADLAPASPPASPNVKSAEIDASLPPAAARSQMFRNASLDSATKESGSADAGKMPVVTIKPDEHTLSPPAQHSDSNTPVKPERLITRIYRPITTSVADLERLIRPLLTPGIGTVAANRSSYSDEETAETLLVRDRSEVLSQIDGVYADLEAGPKRIAIDAVLADIALPDSVVPGWRLRESEFGVVKAEPRAVIDSLRGVGRVTVIATNQLQIVDRQWGRLEWTEQAALPASGHEPAQRLTTKVRIRPTLLANGLVRLEIHPTSTRFKEAGAVDPHSATVAFTTDVALHSGATALIAGCGDEPSATAESGQTAAKIVPKIHPRPSLRHETILLLMPRISRDDLADRG